MPGQEQAAFVAVAAALLPRAQGEGHVAETAGPPEMPGERNRFGGLAISHLHTSARKAAKSATSGDVAQV